MKHTVFTVSILFLTFLLIGSATFLVSPLIGAIASSLHVATAAGGLLVSSYAFSYVVFTFALAPVSDRVERRLLLVIGMLLFAAGLLMSALSANMPLMLAARAVTGIGAAIVSPAVWSYIGDVVTPEQSRRITAIVASALSLGLIVGVPAGSWLAKFSGWRTCFAYMAGIAFAVTIGLLFLQRTALADVHRAKGGWYDLFPGNYCMCYGTSFLINFSLFGLYTYLGYDLEHTFHISSAQSFGPFMLAGCGNLAGVLIAGRLPAVKPPKKQLSLLAFFLAATFLMIPLAHRHLIIYLIVTVGWMGAGGALFAAIQSLVPRLSQMHRGAVVAVNNGFMWSGTAAGSATFGPVVSYFGFSAAALVCFIMTLFAALLLTRFRLGAAAQPLRRGRE
ncbi:MAG: MFS transporter [Sporolactobacillus sp.]